MNIDIEEIRKRAPSNFSVQMDGDVLSFTTTRDGKPYELTVNVNGVPDAFVESLVRGAIRTCELFNGDRA